MGLAPHKYNVAREIGAQTDQYACSYNPSLAAVDIYFDTAEPSALYRVGPAEKLITGGGQAIGVSPAVTVVGELPG